MSTTEQAPQVAPAAIAPHGRKPEYISMRVYAQEGGGYRAFVQVKWNPLPGEAQPEDTVIETQKRTTWGDAMSDGVKLSKLLEGQP